MIYVVTRELQDFDGWSRGNKDVLGYTSDEELVQRIRLAPRKTRGNLYYGMHVSPIHEVSESQLESDGFL